MEAVSQIDFLQQKELKTSNSLNNRLIAGASKTPSLSQENWVLAKARPFYPNSKNSKLTDFYKTELDLEYEILNFKKRICHDHPKKILVLQYQNKDNKNDIVEFRKPLFCNSPYCDGENCFKDRLKKAKKQFRLYFYAYPTWRTKRGKRWGHWGFGFKRKSLPNRNEIADMKRNLQLFLLKLSRIWRIKGIGVRDLAHDIEKIGEEFFIHFHFALRPFFNAADKQKTSKILKKINKIGLPMGIKPNFFGMRNVEGKNGLINYFARRHAGEFEHDYTGTSWKFPDIMDEESYLNSFFGSRKTMTIGFSRKEKKIILIEFLEFLKREAFELSTNNKDTIAHLNLNLKEFYNQYSLICWYITEKPPDKPPDFINPKFTGHNSHIPEFEKDPNTKIKVNNFRFELGWKF